MMTFRRIAIWFAVASATLAMQACRRDMQDQPKYKPLRSSHFFPDGRASRPIPPGTIARDELNDTDPAHTGMQNGVFVNQFPAKVTKAALLRGQERYNIFCTPCHGFLGDGNGMVAKRGFKWPANLHTDRLRNAPPGYLFAVISNGWGAMPAYKDQINVDDRWDIIAYVRALQLSRNANIADVPANVKTELEKQP